MTNSQKNELYVCIPHDKENSYFLQESVVLQLRQDLENMTNACAANENDITGHKIKVLMDTFWRDSSTHVVFYQSDPHGEK